MTRPPDKKQELIERLTKLWNETAGLSHEETIDRLADFILVRDASITSEVSTSTIPRYGRAREASWAPFSFSHIVIRCWPALTVV
jgi:hypothetical protein